MKKLIQSGTEFLPLIIFFIFFKLYGMVDATKAVVISSLIMLTLNYIVNKNVPPLTVISVLLLSFFGALTVYTNDSRYIKLKPTIVNLVFALVLIAGVVAKKPFLKKLLGQKIKFKSDKIWHSLALRFAIFFLVLAFLNEIIWRNFSDDVWVWFKTIGIIVLNFIFLASQVKFITRNVAQPKKNKS